MCRSTVALEASNLIHVITFVGCYGLVTETPGSSSPAASWPGWQKDAETGCVSRRHVGPRAECPKTVIGESVSR